MEKPERAAETKRTQAACSTILKQPAYRMKNRMPSNPPESAGGGWGR